MKLHRLITTVFFGCVTALISPMLHGQYLYVGSYHLTNTSDIFTGTSSISAFRISGSNTIAAIGTFQAFAADFGGAGGSLLAVAVDPQNRFVFAGNGGFNDGKIRAYRIGVDGGLTSLAVYYGPISAHALAIDPSGSFLYAAGRDENTGRAGVTAFRISASGQLTQIGTWSPPLADGRFNTIAIDANGTFLYAAATGGPGGTMWMFRINTDGTLTGIDGRSMGTAFTHAVQIAPDPAGRFLFMVLHGGPGIGTNHLLALPLSNTALRIPDDPAGLLAAAIDLHTLTEHQQMLAVDPSGKFVYAVANFSSDETNVDLVTFAVGNDGALSPISSVKLDLASSRDVAVEPTGKLVFSPACSDFLCTSANLGGFAVDSGGALTFVTAAPTAAGSEFSMGTTSCTASLPGFPANDRTVKLSQFLAPVVNSTSVQLGTLSQRLTFAGSLRTTVQTSTLLGCPATSYSLHYELSAKAVTQHGNDLTLMSNGTVDGTTLAPGKFALSIPARINPPTAIPADAITLQTFVTMDATGAVSSVSTPPSDLVSWWQAENSAADATGNNPGTAVNVTYVPGRVGNAFHFNPDTNSDLLTLVPYVEVASSPTLKPKTVTVTAWVKNNFHPGVNRYVVSQGAKTCFAASYALYTGGGNLTFYISDGSSYIESPDAGPIWDGQWHFIAGVYDGTAVRLYVDGTQMGTGTAAIVPINYAEMDNDNFYIGAYRGSCNLGFTGSVDEVRVFDRALTTAEIQSLY